MSTETEKKDVMDPQLEEEEDDDMPGLVEVSFPLILSFFLSFSFSVSDSFV